SPSSTATRLTDLPLSRQIRTASALYSSVNFRLLVDISCPPISALSTSCKVSAKSGEAQSLTLWGPKSHLMGSKSQLLGSPTTPHERPAFASGYPHFESPQFKHVKHPSIITTAAVEHFGHSCAPSGKWLFAKASTCLCFASNSAFFCSMSFLRCSSMSGALSRPIVCRCFSIT